MIQRDFPKPGDMAALTKPIELGRQAQAKIEQATRKLEQAGAGSQPLTPEAAKVKGLSEGPVANDDWMTLRGDRLSPGTQDGLARQGLTGDQVLADPDKAEAYVGQVFSQEGIPDGNGGAEQTRNGVVPGHYDGKHGIDLVAADQHGTPTPIEVKKYGQPSAAALEDQGVTNLELEVEQWRKGRQSEVSAYQHGRLTDKRPDAAETWKPEPREWKSGLRDDAHRMTRNDRGKPYLPVQQMDDLWTRDRWLKIIKTPEGQERMRSVGVAEKYLDHGRLRSSPDLPEWQAILDRRTAVIVSDRQGDVGRRLFGQAVFEKRMKRVVKIEV